MLRDYRYILVRYVPNPERMEPTNVGVILQGNGRVDVRINPDAGRRDDVDTDLFRQFRTFFTKEIQNPQVPLFQPDRSTVDFLVYLANQCMGPVYLSRPLALQVGDGASFDSIIADLYLRLVAPPASPPKGEEKRPTSRFRMLAKERRFTDRGLRKYSHVRASDDAKLWTAYRQVINGEVIVMDKVEIGREIGGTSNEIDKLPTIARHLQSLLESDIGGKRAQYYLLADEFTEPFRGQPEEEFALMKADLAERIEEIRSLGGEIIRSPSEAAALAEELDQKLPPFAQKS
jgi:hypothetical protein